MGTEPHKKMKPERMGHRVTLKKKGLMKKAPPQDRMSLERKLAEGQKLAEEEPLLRPWASRARSKRSNKVTLSGGHLWELAAPFHPLFTPLLSEQGVISTPQRKHCLLTKAKVAEPAMQLKLPVRKPCHCF